MATVADVAAAQFWRPQIFRDTVLGIGPAEQCSIILGIEALRAGLVTLEDVRRLIESFLPDLPSPPAVAAAVDGIVGRIQDYLTITACFA